MPMLEQKIEQMNTEIQAISKILDIQSSNQERISNTMDAMNTTLREVVALQQEQARQNEKLKAMEDKCDERNNTIQESIRILYKKSAATKCFTNSERLNQLEKEDEDTKKEIEKLNTRLWSLFGGFILAVLGAIVSYTSKHTGG